MIRIGHMPMPLAPESSTGHGFPEHHFHRERWAGDKLLDSAGRDAADAVGLATVEAEGEVVEVGLQVFRLDRAGMRAEQPARQQRHRPVHALQAVALLPLGRRVPAHLVWPVAEAPGIVARKPVGRDTGLGGDVLVGETLERGLIVVVGVGEAHTPVGFGGDEHHRFSPTLAPNQSFIDLNGLGERLTLQAHQCGSQLVQTLSLSSHGVCLSLDLAPDCRTRTACWSVRRARDCAA